MGDMFASWAHTDAETMRKTSFGTPSRILPPQPRKTLATNSCEHCRENPAKRAKPPSLAIIRYEHVLADMGFDVAVCRFAWKASGGRLEVALENLLDGRSAAGYKRAKAKQQKQEAAALAKEMANEAAAVTAAAAAVRAGRGLSFADPLTICAGSTAGELARAAGHRRLADMLADVAAGRQLEMVMTALLLMADVLTTT